VAPQLRLFETPNPVEGFVYEENFLSSEEEAALVTRISALPFREFEFHGFVGKRRVVSFGWKYEFSSRRVQKADEIPEFLLPVRGRAACVSGLPAARFQHALVTEYQSGAAIGWHKDKAVFGDVIGISLAAPCSFRFRRKRGSSWHRRSLMMQPRSMYLLSGPSRTQWEHSIPPVEQLRYSITFRNFAGERVV
jgi:alkylated DNA repair dioxygenase AlkB